MKKARLILTLTSNKETDKGETAKDTDEGETAKDTDEGKNADTDTLNEGV